MVDLPEKKGTKYWKYFEHSKMELPETNVKKGDRLLCRIEKFLDETNAVDDIVTGLIGGCATQLLAAQTGVKDETAVLYKEKINLKLPGAGVFSFVVCVCVCVVCVCCVVFCVVVIASPASRRCCIKTKINLKLPGSAFLFSVLVF
jgi:hypothetical protein